MRILKFSFAFVMCLILPFMFMACGNKNGTESGDGDTTPPATINSPYFEITNGQLTKVKAGVTLPSEITIPAGVTQIGTLNDTGTTGVFEGNTTITKVILPSSLKYIFYAAFKNCSNLTQVTFANVDQAKLEQIFPYAFGSTGLTSFTFPASCKQILSNSFTDSNITATFKDKTNWKLYTRNGNKDVLERAVTESDFSDFVNSNNRYKWGK